MEEGMEEREVDLAVGILGSHPELRRVHVDELVRHRDDALQGPSHGGARARQLPLAHGLLEA
eukprot:1110843-Prymnesium_polylepis.1